MAMFDGMGIDKNFLNNGMALNTGNLNDIPGMIKKMPSEHQNAIGDLFNSEMSQDLDFKIWMKIISLQKSFNDRVSPGWLEDKNQEKYNTWMAILDESVEVLGSKQWKWWKDTEGDALNKVDWDNVNVEMIDLLHFILSISLQTQHQDLLYMTLTSFEKNKRDGRNEIFTEVRDSNFFSSFWEEFLMAVWQKSLPLLIVKWGEFYYRSGGDFQKLARDYFIKNALNHIRQEFGYNSGKYIKAWRDPGDAFKTVEDNVAARKLLGGIEKVTENSITEMETILRKYYLEFVTV